LLAQPTHSRTMAMWMLMLGAAAVATVSAQNEGPGRGSSALFCLPVLSSPQHWHVYSSLQTRRCSMCLSTGGKLKLTSQRILISLPAGPWEVVTPESMGLSTAALQKAETDTSNAAGSRYCYLVVKKVCVSCWPTFFRLFFAHEGGGTAHHGPSTSHLASRTQVDCTRTLSSPHMSLPLNG
jgi:hypothetical protein